VEEEEVIEEGTIIFVSQNVIKQIVILKTISGEIKKSWGTFLWENISIYPVNSLPMI
jgi:hypothetical protein